MIDGTDCAPTTVAHLALYYHPLSSCCHKVLIALDELGIALELRLSNLGDPSERDAFLALWPTGKMPLLVDSERVVPETSIIIEHLQRQHALPGCILIPHDPAAALEVRLWDHLLDLYVMTPMQACTADLMRPEAERDALAVVRAKDTLRSAFAMLDRQLAGRPWLAGEAFSLADCAAAPALFYAVAYLPGTPDMKQLTAYIDRLMPRPSVAKAIDAARPYFKYFPGRAGLARHDVDEAAPNGVAPSA